jgi:hypothetical protein
MKHDDFEQKFQTFIKYFNIFERKKDKPKIEKLADLDLSFITNFREIASATHRGINYKDRFIKPSLDNSYFKDKNLWLIKPISFNRGRGIQIFCSLNQLIK